MKIKYRYSPLNVPIFGISSMIGMTWTIYEAEYLFSILFAAIFLISFFVYGLGGTLSINEISVLKQNLFTKNVMKWSEVIEIEYDKAGWAFNLKGRHCQLPIPGPCFWSAKNYREFAEQFQNIIEIKDIPKKKKSYVFFKFSINTKL